MTKFKGIKAFEDRPDLVVPPLNFRSLQELQGRLQSFKLGGIDPESLDTVVDAAHAALTRNYPDMTRDEVIDLLDVGNMADVMEAIMDVSGLKRKRLEAEETNGNPSTGLSSTPT